MILKFTLSNGKAVTVPTTAPTMEAFMEEFAGMESQVFGGKTKYMNKYGGFLDIYGVYIRYSEIVVIEEVPE